MLYDQMDRVSVIIPTLDEAEWLEGCLRSVRDSFASTSRAIETVVVDGGSQDESISVARQSGADIVLEASRRGRARQLKRGVRASSGRWLVFLHADARLTIDWAEEFDAIAGAGLHSAGEGAVPCGGWSQVEIFSRRNVSMVTRAGLRCVESGINWRTRAFSTATGDQALFVDRDVLESIGGIPDVPILEGNRLARRLRTCSDPGNPLRIMRGPVRISARRWIDGGILGTSLKMYAVRVADRLGVPLAWLASWWETTSPDA